MTHAATSKVENLAQGSSCKLKFVHGPSCGVTYDHHSDNSRGVFMLLESSIMLLKNINSTGVTNDNHHMMIKIFFSTGH